jgi:hypothetical protein
MAMGYSTRPPIGFSLLNILLPLSLPVPRKKEDGGGGLNIKVTRWPWLYTSIIQALSRGAGGS